MQTPASQNDEIAAEPKPSAGSNAVCAVIVSYFPTLYCFDCMRSIVGSAAHTVIVDNGSSAETVRQLQALFPERATVIANGRNLGVGAALNIGVGRAHEMGFAWMLMFDQDTELLSGAIEHILEVRDARARSSASPPGLVGSAYLNRYEDGRVSQCPPAAESTQGWTEETVVITSGSLISWDIFSRFGAFRDDFFIDHIDHEYCLRLLSGGCSIVRTVRPLQIHRLGRRSEVRSLLSLGRSKMINEYQPLRYYYQVRNFVLLKRLYPDRFQEFFSQQCGELRHQLIRCLKYETGSGAKLAAALHGLIDGLRGVSGMRSPLR